MAGIITARNAVIMRFIHQRPAWPAFVWDDREVLGRLVTTRHRQGLLLGRMAGIGFEGRAEAALRVLTSDVVGSAAIEGERLDEALVRSSIARRLGLPHGGVRRATRAVDGFVEVLLDATRRASAPLTAARLYGWHAALFPVGYSGTRPIAVGCWRPVEAGAMQVVSGPIGRERVHFEAPPAERVPAEMDRFLSWCDAPGPLDPVLRAAIAHFWFVTIHPFEDGNGRVARALADLLLARADGCAERFYSMSMQIEAERKDYYRLLERVQRGNLDITPWLTWFLECLSRAIDGAGTLVDGVLRKAEVWQSLAAGPPVNQRQRLVINRLLDGFVGGLSTAKYARMAKCSPDTALRDIQDLVTRGLLVKNPGRGRSTSYRLTEPRA